MVAVFLLMRRAFPQSAGCSFHPAYGQSQWSWQDGATGRDAREGRDPAFDVLGSKFQRLRTSNFEPPIVSPVPLVLRNSLLIQLACDGICLKPAFGRESGLLALFFDQLLREQPGCDCLVPVVCCMLMQLL